MSDEWVLSGQPNAKRHQRLEAKSGRCFVEQTDRNEPHHLSEKGGNWFKFRDRMWRYSFEPFPVQGECDTEEGAKAMAMACARQWNEPGIRWAKSTPVYRVEEDGTERCGLIAVVGGLVLRVEWVQGERIGTIRTPAEAGWDWSVLREGRRVADGWTKTRAEATMAAELAAQAQP